MSDLFLSDSVALDSPFLTAWVYGFVILPGSDVLVTFYSVMHD